MGNDAKFYKISILINKLYDVTRLSCFVLLWWNIDAFLFLQASTIMKKHRIPKNSNKTQRHCEIA